MIQPLACKDPSGAQALARPTPGLRLPAPCPTLLVPEPWERLTLPMPCPLFPMLRSPMVDARALNFQKTRCLALIQDHGVELAKFSSLLHDHKPGALLGRWSTFLRSGLI